MHYEAAVERLYALGAELHTAPGQPRRKFELADMRTLMAALGDPQKSFRSVLIAGTNGKGSTAATLASILAAAGYRTGLYTSPHLIRVNERIQVLQGDEGPGADQHVIPDDSFAALFTEVEAAADVLMRAGRLPGFPSFFECLTAMAFLHFSRVAVDIAVLEVGMGGRLDATNIVEPLLSIITDISLDHTEWLGSTLPEIAREKAGILRRNGVLVTLPQHPEVNQVVGEMAVSLGVRGINAADFLPGRSAPTSLRNAYTVMVDGEVLEVNSPLAGQHQQRNLALAIAAARELGKTKDISNSKGHVFNIDVRAMSEGIRRAQWPGRLERVLVDEGRHEFLLDVGHNPAGAWALRAALSGDGVRSRTLIFGCLRDKPVRELGQILFPVFDRVLLVRVDSARASSLKEMQAAAADVGAVAEAAESVEEAIARASALTESGGQIVITGSVFLVGAARKALAKQVEQTQV